MHGIETDDVFFFKFYKNICFHCVDGGFTVYVIVVVVYVILVIVITVYKVYLFIRTTESNTRRRTGELGVLGLYSYFKKRYDGNYSQIYLTLFLVK